MRQKKRTDKRFNWGTFSRLAVFTVLFTGGFAARSMAKQPGQKTFSSPHEATSALVTAMKDKDEKLMLEILGPDGKHIVYSGDEVEDAQSQANFVERQQEMDRLVKEPDGSVVLYIGGKNWPTPIPIVKKGNAWFLDTEAGKKEISYRRIGRNEISTIKVCQALVAAEREYYATQHNEYAKQIFSDEGQHNGLYWKAADGEPQSPIGPLVAWWRLGTVKMLESHITSGKPLHLETDRQAADRDCTISRTVRRTRG